jgi:phosphoenolpyruvate carboxykinase (GTP)
MSLGTILDKTNLAKLYALKNKHVEKIILETISLCQPAKATILTDSKKDIDYIRQLALTNYEESLLDTPGHTIHFDGFFDQGRDKEKTKVLITKDEHLSPVINTGERKECLSEIFSLLKGIMMGKEMFVAFYCLGPVNSRFSIPALQITDSAYVVHSENMLYRQGYQEFKSLKGSKEFFHFIHSAGKLTGNDRVKPKISSLKTDLNAKMTECKKSRYLAEEKYNLLGGVVSEKIDIEDLPLSPVSKNHDLKRIYIDLAQNRVFSVNTQYAGNSVGLKKLALRLAIYKANRQDWLSEHMLLMGAKPPTGKKRTTYFAGAFPSGCGKTSTAMIAGQTIVGDDIIYLRKDNQGFPKAVNVESGIFGIIENINPADDPLIYKVITTPKEVIFSNVLVKDGKPYWLGMGKDLPNEGINFSGKWSLGKKDQEGKEILSAHKNARYTVKIEELPNANSHLHDPKGVTLSGIIYGGRDYETSPPVLEAFDWNHGVFMGATIESATTATIVGKVGERVHNPMSNIDFLVVPLNKYLSNHLRFGRSLKVIPKVFTTNFFLKKDGKFLNEKVDKKVWLSWMEGRVHDEYEAITTPIGLIPTYNDLKYLFHLIFHKTYTKKDYEDQFSLRLDKLLEKLSRMEKALKSEKVPSVLLQILRKQKRGLVFLQKKYKSDLISPFSFHSD